jgi:cytoskeleton protein RodZ
MIERASEFGSTSAAPPNLASGADKTAGAMLREAREAHGLHIDIVASALKVPTQKLQALEDDNIAALPDPVFARALAASVCRALQVDPAPVLAKLPGALKPGLADADRTISTSFRSGAPRSGRNGGRGLPSRGLLIVVALLLVGAAILFWLPPGAFGRLSAALPGGSGPTTSTAGGAASSAGDASAGSGASQPGMVTEPVAVASLPSATSSAMPTPGAAAPAAVAPAASAPAAFTGDTVVFVARSASWITVTEAGGRQLLRRNLQAGETVGLSGRLPMSVVVGRAAGIDVTVRGQPFDIAAVSGSGGVARFEIKP